MRRVGVLVLAEPDNGGTFQYTLSMLEALKLCKGISITLYTNVGNEYYATNGFQVKYVKATPKEWPSLLVRYLIGILKKDPFESEDLVLAPIYSPLLLHTRKPFVFTLHDLQERYLPQNFSALQKLWRKTIYTLLTKKASGVICESKFVQQDIIHFFDLPENKVWVITAPPTTQPLVEYTLEHLKQVRDKYNLPTQYLFYPSQFWPHKNHMRLVEAFSSIADQFPSVGLVLTGQKRDEFEKVFARVSELGLSKKIIHTGYVDQPDLGALYKCASALVMPSLFESVSIPIYEAFQYGLPVCASNVVALPEQVGNAGLLFDPYSVEAIAESMRTALSSKELLSELANNGKIKLGEMSHQKYEMEISKVLSLL